jgi:hypothetical protein
MIQKGIKTSVKPQRYTRVRPENNNKYNSGFGTDRLKGWVGEIDSSTTTDTGTEAINFSVVPSTQKAFGHVANKVVDGVINKVTGRPGSISPRNTLRTAIRTKRTIKVYGRIEDHLKIKTAVNRTSGNFRRFNKSYSNAQIDKSITQDSGIESVQSIRQGKEKVHNSIQTARSVVNAGKTVKAIATQRTIKPAIIHRANSAQYSGFYEYGSQVDMSTSSNTGVESVKGTIRTIKTVKNVKVGVRKTAEGIKKTYRFSKQIHTKTKSAVRNTRSMAIKLKNAKSAASKATIVRTAAVRNVKAAISAIKALFNPIVLKIAAVLVALVLIILFAQFAVTAVINIFNSTFGWLIPSEDSIPGTVLSTYQQKITNYADTKNTYYNNPSNFGVDKCNVNGYVDPSLFKEVLAVTIVHKQRVMSNNKDVDPDGIYDLSNIKDISDKEFQSIFSKFYSVNVQRGTYTEVSTDTVTEVSSKGAITTKTVTKTHTYSCVNVDITNYSTDAVMTKLGFTDYEKDTVRTVIAGIDSIVWANFSDMPDSGGSVDVAYLASVVVDPDAFRLGDLSNLYGDVDVNPVFAGRLAALAEDEGKQLFINSGTRTIAEQQAIWDSTPEERRAAYVARPGTSRHQFGIAADVGGWAENISDSKLSKYGLYRRVSYEPWHFEPIEARK